MRNTQKNCQKNIKIAAKNALVRRRQQIEKEERNSPFCIPSVGTYLLGLLLYKTIAYT
jgi:hypothetical protein